MSNEPSLIGPELLQQRHKTEIFSCGRSSLDKFLRQNALANQKGGSARTYVVSQDDQVVGYYSLAPGSVRLEDAVPRVQRGQARHPVPVILLARLAIDQQWQGRGLGKHLLLDAFRRANEGAEVIGGRAVLIHALDDDAKRFYLKYGAEASPTDPLHLMVLIKDLRKMLTEVGLYNG
ncbi:MAG: GNAT family N-acetyltransferase [Fimbriimonadaceae bacterium]